MKVIGYIRVSTEGQAMDGVSLDAQESKLRAWAELNDADNFLLFCDAGVSGKRADNRPGLRNALESIEKGDALIVYSLSRLTRSTEDTIRIARDLEAKGADLVSLNEKIDTTTAAGKMVFRMLAVLNEFERDQVSERTRHALAHKRIQGFKTGGSVPFGYSVDGGKLIPDSGEQKAIKLILKLRDKGHSLRKIAVELEKRGIHTKNGCTDWNPKTLAAIIRREGHAA